MTFGKGDGDHGIGVGGCIHTGLEGRIGGDFGEESVELGFGHGTIDYGLSLSYSIPERGPEPDLSFRSCHGLVHQDRDLPAPP